MVTAQYNPFAPGVHADPYPMYRQLREEDPVHWSELMDSWVLTRYDDMVAVLTDGARFSADRRSARNRFTQMAEQVEQEFGPFGRTPTMLTSDPPLHTRLRRLVSKAFTPRAVENLRPRIQDIVDHILAGVREGGGMDIIWDLAYPLPVIVIAEMLGVAPEDRDKFKRWSDDVVATLGGPFIAPDVMQRAQASVTELSDYFKGIIGQRRQEPRDDLISGLIAAEEQGQVLSEDEILATCILLLVAGNETTTNLIGGSVLTLLQHPQQLEQLRRDPALIQTAVEELLRFAGPVHATGRVVKEDMEIGGQAIKEGQVAFCVLAAGNRDPAQFADPETVDIGRQPNEHLAFGDGIHFCLGAPLARAEAQIAIGSLVERFPKLRIATAELEWGGTFIIRGLKKLPVGV
ncbi:MAG TPA: cytochrome P450 [Dehalococcoidia bacterium]|nr:cytochrome P450 [Dehalococcoidia bacterium]